MKRMCQRLAAFILLFLAVLPTKAIPTISLSIVCGSDVVICEGQPIPNPTFSATATGYPPFSGNYFVFTWTDGTNTYTENVVGTVNPDLSVTATGTLSLSSFGTLPSAPGVYNFYTLTVKNLAGKTAVCHPTLTINPSPVLALTPQQYCEKSLTAGAMITLGTVTPGGASVTWEASGATTDSGSGLTVPAPTAVGVTHYKVTATLASCTDVKFVDVIVNPTPVLSLTPQAVCEGFAGPILLGSATAGATISWTSEGATVSSGSDLTAPTPAVGTTTYHVKATLGAGPTECSAMADVTVTVNSKPVISVNSQTICFGNSVTLTASGAPAGASFSWSPGGAATDSITVNPATTTTYTVTVTSAEGCVGTASGTVTVNPKPALELVSTRICQGTAVNIVLGTASSGASVSWLATGASPGSGSGLVVPSPAPGTTHYVVTASFGSGSSLCSVTKEVDITIDARPTVSVSDATACLGSSVTLTANASAGVTFAWSTGATTPSITVTPTATTPYSVTVTTAAGCQAIATAVVTVSPVCVDPALGLGVADGCTVLQLGVAKVSITGPAGGILGDVCIAPGGSLDMSGDEYVTGNINLGAGAHFSNSSHGTVNVVQNVNLTDEINAAYAANQNDALLPCTQSFVTLDGKTVTTITGGVGTNVICVRDISLSGKQITISGPPGAKFIFNVSGKFVFTGGGAGPQIRVSGGVTPKDVIYNIIGSGADVAFSGGGGGVNCCAAIVDGTLLAPYRKINLAPGLVNGQIISGKDISIVSGSSVRCPTCQ